MQTLITPTVVVARAFADGEYVDPKPVSEAAIVAAQETYLRPVTGDALFERLLAGDHADFADEYLAAPLALYVRYLIAPQLDLRHGQGGTVQPDPTASRRPPTQRCAAARRALLKTARRLLRRASDYLESHAAQFPLYDPQANVLNRCSIDGKLVQTH